MYYAQIDANNYCVGVSKLSGEVNLSNLIKLEKYDTALLGKKYVNGEFVEIENPDQQEVKQLTESEILMLGMAELFEENQRIKELLEEVLSHA